MAYILNKPYTTKEYNDFVSNYGQNCFNQRAYTMPIVETEQYVFALEPWEKVEGGIVVEDKEAWEQEQAEKEAERIAMLKLTRGDVFRGLLQAKQVTRAMIRQQLEALPEETPEQMLTKEMALIDFDEALDFYRGNPLIDTVGATLGITSEQLDKFFETNDYTYLLPPIEPTEETEPTEPVEESLEL